MKDSGVQNYRNINVVGLVYYVYLFISIDKYDVFIDGDFKSTIGFDSHNVMLY